MDRTTFSTDGTGNQGGEIAAWTVTENATPVAPGAPAAAAGGTTVTVDADDESDLLVGDEYTLTDTEYGTVSGRITNANLGPLGVSITGDNPIGRLSAVRTVPPGGKNPGDLVRVVPSPLVAGFSFGDAAVNPVNGLMYALVSNGPYVFRYSADGQHLGFFGGSGSGNGQFSNTGSVFYNSTISVDPASGNVYVLDRGNNRIQWFSPVGSYLGQLTELNLLTLTVADNRLYASTVFESGVSQSSILTFNLDGTGRSVFAGTGLLGGAVYNDLAVTDNYVFVAQANLTRWTKLSKSGVAEPWRERAFEFGAGIIPTAFRGSGNHIYIGIRLLGDNNGVSFVRGWQYRVGHENSELSSSAVVIERSDDISGPSGNNVPVTPEGDLVQFNTALADPPLVRFYAAGSPRPKLSTLFQNYLDSLNAEITLDYQATVDPLVAAPGWTDSVWTKLNELCVAYNVEIALVDDTLTVRDVGSASLNVEDMTPVSKQVSLDGASRYVDIQYSNARAGVDIMYDAAKDGSGRTFEVAVREDKTETILTANFPVALQQPERTTNINFGPGQYYLIGSDNLPIQLNQFEAYGGSVAVALTPGVPGSIDLHLIGPAIEIPGVPGPYRLAISDGSNTYPAFSVLGTGVLVNPQTVRMSTGADWEVVTNDVSGAALANPFIGTRAQAWDRGRWAAVDAAGTNMSLSFTISHEGSNGFGLTTGSLFTAYNAVWRVTSASFGIASVSVTAVNHTRFGDVQPLIDGSTIAEFFDTWGSNKVKDFRIRPLTPLVD